MQMCPDRDTAIRFGLGEAGRAALSLTAPRRGAELTQLATEE